MAEKRKTPSQENAKNYRPKRIKLPSRETHVARIVTQARHQKKQQTKEREIQSKGT